MRHRKIFPILILFSIGVVFLPGCKSKKVSIQKNLIIILVDALRLDHLGVYGYYRNTSPNIDKFASNALVFDKAISQSGWTAPAVMALFSSNYPQDNLNKSKTFAEWLLKNNYQTAAFTTNPIMIEKMGYNKGFENYNLLEWKEGSAVVDLTLEWLGLRDVNKPFYLYLHFMDVHDPYKPLPPYDTKFGEKYEGSIDGDIIPFKELLAEKKDLKLSEKDIQKLEDLYDCGIAYADNQFARLIAGLKKAGVYDNSIIVFVTDHGDEFMEHSGIGHGHSVFEELIHIPLIIKGIEKAKEGSYTGLFELIDLAPTLMDMLGIPFDYKVTGKSFVKHLGKNRELKNIAFSEVHRTIGINAGNWAVSARTQTQKIIYYPLQRKYSIFDIRVDKKERNPIEGDQDKSVRLLKTSLQKWRKIFGSTSKPKSYDDEYIEALRSLGYIK